MDHVTTGFRVIQTETLDGLCNVFVTEERFARGLFSFQTTKPPGLLWLAACLYPLCHRKIKMYGVTSLLKGSIIEHYYFLSA